GGRADSEHTDPRGGDGAAIAIKNSPLYRHVIDHVNRQLFGRTINLRPATTMAGSNGDYLTNNISEGDSRQIFAGHIHELGAREGEAKMTIRVARGTEC